MLAHYVGLGSKLHVAASRQVAAAQKPPSLQRVTPFAIVTWQGEVTSEVMEIIIFCVAAICADAHQTGSGRSRERRAMVESTLQLCGSLKVGMVETVLQQRERRTMSRASFWMGCSHSNPIKTGTMFHLRTARRCTWGEACR